MCLVGVCVALFRDFPFLLLPFFFLFLLLLFLTFSALVANPKKLLYTVANLARGLLNREKKKKKSGSAPPPARCSFGEKKEKRNHATHPHI